MPLLRFRCPVRHSSQLDVTMGDVARCVFDFKGKGHGTGGHRNLVAKALCRLSWQWHLPTRHHKAGDTTVVGHDPLDPSLLVWWQPKQFDALDAEEGSMAIQVDGQVPQGALSQQIFCDDLDGIRAIL